ncbi:unnamed protein product [Microthlaspi erraticum]|uniref:Rho-GAP domain-containing protein n=1 Tax=Microthlaspi erraticum TaxID=1685480 RepID=A0A6D2L091_9BRAS|nr:unnamed protein product [Microthlaspi erraticum]
MQLSYDTRGNIVPTILLMMQSHLYNRGGLRVEGIFRINGENGQEEYIREELNKGVIPDNIDVHCLASLIKGTSKWCVGFTLSGAQMVKMSGFTLSGAKASLLDWAINLMADVVEMEHVNKMNARNIAMVFAPNMTQMLDPLTALMYAVKVMNFLKTLIEKTLKDRKESREKLIPASNSGHRDHNGDQSSSRQLLHLMKANKEEALDSSEAEMRDKEDYSAEEEEEEESAGYRELVGIKKKSLVKSCNNGGGFGQKQSGWNEHRKKTKVSNASSIVGRVNYRVELFDAWR